MKRVMLSIIFGIFLLVLITNVYADVRQAQCSLSSDCATDESCVNYICQRTSIQPGAQPVRVCYIDSDCLSGKTCQKGVCIGNIPETSTNENYIPYLIIGIAITVGFIILALILRRRK